MNIAVIIPSHHRVPQELLRWTVDGYLGQELGEGQRLEVFVGVDGAPEAGETTWTGESGVQVTRRGFARMGAAAVRNRLVAGAMAHGAELLIFGNADARPDADMVRRHVEAFKGLPGGGQGCMVLGSAPWEMPARAVVFDVLLAETPMVFFYDQLKAGEWYDFRQCWTLNVSVLARDFERVGGFWEELRPVYYEDLAFGHRFLGERKGILYVPGARVTHRHPTTLEQYLDREELLGLMAPVLGRVCPEAFGAVFGTTDVAGLAGQYRAWVGMDGAMHRWTYERLAAWAGLAAEALPGEGEERRRVVETIYQMHVPLKRLAFRLGFLRGVGLAGDERWEERVVRGEWRGVVGRTPLRAH